MPAPSSIGGMTGAAEEIPLYYPMTTEHAFDSPVYVVGAGRVL